MMFTPCGLQACLLDTRPCKLVHTLTLAHWQAHRPARRRMAPHGSVQVVCAETSRRQSSTVTKKRAGAPPLPPIDDEVCQGA